MADGSIAGVEPQQASQLPPAIVAPVAADVAKPRMATDPPGAKDDPIRDLVDRMKRLQPGIARIDSGTAAGIRRIVQQAEQPGRIEDPAFRTQVAYLLQDVEKAHGPMRSVHSGFREEMARLAATSPGLQNEQMQALVRATASIDDRGLVRDIRRGAAEIAKEGSQASPDTQSRIDVFENRVRLSQGMAGQAEVARPEAKQAAASTNNQAPEIGEIRKRNSAPMTEIPSFGLREMPADKQAGWTSPIPDTRQMNQAQQAGRLGATFAVLNALRGPEPETPAPWDQNLTPLKGRLERWMENDKGNREEESFKAAERAGQTALHLLRQFASAPESNVMAKIRETAKSDPDGEAGVVAGMREGGPYQDLRRTFNADLVREKGYSALLDRVTAAVNQYGKDRTAADAIAGGRADAASITARFEKLDAEIFKGATSTPSRSEGKSQMEELGDRAAELAKKAVEAFKSVFARSPGAAHGSPGPSPA